MATAALTETPRNLAEALHQLGDIPPERIGLPVGTATEDDLLRALDAADKRLFELVDGILVEKTMGFQEARLAFELSKELGKFLDKNDVGFAFGSDGPVRLRPGRVRLPDIGFVSWESIGDEVNSEAIFDGVPDLAVEIISEGNTRKEMALKLEDYFRAGVRLVWYIRPKTQTIEVHTSLASKRTLTAKDTLDGGEVLPGFALPVKKLFAAAVRRGKGK